MMNVPAIRELTLLLAGVGITIAALKNQPPDTALLATGVGLMAGTGVVARRNGSSGPE
jgi:hypothetical protein